jgi:hypothetical protein
MECFILKKNIFKIKLFEFVQIDVYVNIELNWNTNIQEKLGGDVPVVFHKRENALKKWRKISYLIGFIMIERVPQRVSCAGIINILKNNKYPLQSCRIYPSRDILCKYVVKPERSISNI